jgi:putative tryptophan/tyrosine transport system substrate-binding protein
MNGSKQARMGISTIVVLLIGLSLSSVHLAEAQQSKKVPRIGYLASADPARDSTRAEGIRLALRELGYIEGQNIAIEYRYGEGKRDRLAEVAAEPVRLKVNVIVVAGGASPIRAAINATKTIPIVLDGSGTDPVRAGYVESLVPSRRQRHWHYKP